MLAFIVVSLITAVALVLLIWSFSPAYRARIEYPKYRFQELERALDDHLGPSERRR